MEKTNKYACPDSIHNLPVDKARGFHLINSKGITLESFDTYEEGLKALQSTKGKTLKYYVINPNLARA